MPSAEPRVTYDTIKHGIEELWSAENPAVDIVAVPGLGADPKNCWASSDAKPFNWLTDKDGLRRDFNHDGSPNGKTNARVLLYNSESAWQGRLKVKAELDDLAHALLVGLRTDRKNNEAERRPIVFIGHSMGGLVIAKAICIAHSQRLAFPAMFEAITGALFFGTPFGGTPLAVGASLADRAIGSIVNYTARSSLLEFMKPESSGLKELRREFLALARHPTVGANMHFVCFLEKHPMNLERTTSKLFGFPIIPNSLSTKMVQDDHATLDGYERIVLSKDHSSMVKFSGWKDPEYQLIRGPIIIAVQNATGLAKSRFNTIRECNRDELKDVLTALRGTILPEKMYQDLQKDVRLSDSSWVLKEVECASWLDVSPRSPSTSCLWIQGTEGRGKSSALVSIIEHIKNPKAGCSKGHIQPLCAHFFCSSSHETLTVEELLKSLLYQLIDQQETLYEYAKQFAKKRSSNEASTNLTVENLWFSLTNMLTDTLVDKVYLIVHNLHDLPATEGTAKLLDRLNGELRPPSNADAVQRRSKVRWLFTTRENDNVEQNIEEALKAGAQQTHELNLNDKKYGYQIVAQLHKHADQRVKMLTEQKKYNEAFAYFASSLMGTRAEDTIWIDITYLRLAQIPPNTKDTKLRRELEKIPKNLDQLLDSIWSKILDSGDDDTDDVRELLRVLVLVKEPVTLGELAILTGFTMDEVKKSLDKCKLLLIIEDEKVVFVLENRVKEHLKRRKDLLQVGKDELKWQHGVLAWRCYIHLVKTFRPISEETKACQEDASGSAQGSAPRLAANEPSSGSHGLNSAPIEQENTPRDVILTPEHRDSDETHDTDSISNSEDGLLTVASSLDDPNPYDLDPTKLLHYPIKNWLYHAGQATPEFAATISRQDDFWARGSIIRQKWLWAYVAISKDQTLSLLKSGDFTALHTAASLGYHQLVAALMDNGHADEKDVRDSMFNTPLHLAAFWGRNDIVELLLKRGASVDDGIEDDYDTPLAMAAQNGQVEAMRKLLKRHASVKAMSDVWGPLINCAIASGNKAAVELLVNGKAELSVSKIRKAQTQRIIPSHAPLSLAAFNSDLDMFNFLLDQYRHVLTNEDYEVAFRDASRAGNIPIMESLILLPGFEDEKHNFQEDLDVAVGSKEWGSVRFLVENKTSQQRLNFDDAVIALVEDVDENLDLLEAIWKTVSTSSASLSKEKVDEALYIATDKEKEKTVRLLLTKFEASANATGEEFGDSLTAAAHDGTTGIVGLLIRKGAKVDASTGWALQIAAGRGHKKVVCQLLEEGADVDRMIENPLFPPCTALQAACEGGYYDIVDLLLNHGANPNAGGGQFQYPIIAAACFGYGKILTRLIKAKANVNVTAGEGYWNASPLFFASNALYVGSCIELIEAGAEVNYVDDDGDTPLTVAAMVGDADLVRELLRRGANVMHITKRGINALQYASLGGHNKCVKVLIDWISLLLLGIQKSVDARDEAPVPEVLSSIDYRRLREEVMEQQEAASEALNQLTVEDPDEDEPGPLKRREKFITTDFFADRNFSQNVTSDNYMHGESPDKDPDSRDLANNAGDGQHTAGDAETHDESGSRGPGTRCRGFGQRGEAETDDDEAQVRDGNNDRGIKHAASDEGGPGKDGDGNSHNDDDDEYATIQRTAQMQLSEGSSRNMPRGYGEDDIGNGPDADDGDVENGEEGHMMDDNGDEGQGVEEEEEGDEEKEADEAEEDEQAQEGQEGEEGEECEEGHMVDNNDEEGDMMDDDEYRH